MDRAYSPNSYTNGQRNVSAGRVKQSYIKPQVSSYTYKPNTASKAKEAVRESNSLSGIRIVAELTGEEFNSQTQAIELERLKTTCFSLNTKAKVSDDLKNENQMLRKRIDEL